MHLDIFRLLDYFLPAKLLRRNHQASLMKGRVLVFLSLMYLSSLSMVAVLLALLSALGVFTLWSAVLSSSLSCGIYALQLRYFKRGGDLRRAANIGMLTMVTTTASCVLLTGGATSPVMIILLCTPTCAFLMEGKNAGLLWSVVVAFICAAFLQLRVQGITLPNMIDAKLMDYLSYCSWLYGFIIVAGGMTFYGSLTEKANVAAKQERLQLKNKATYDALTGVYSRQAFMQRLPQWQNEQKNAAPLLFMEFDIETRFALQREHMEQLLIRCVETLQLLFDSHLVLSRNSGSSFQGLLFNVHDGGSAIQAMDLVNQQLEALSDGNLVKVTMGAAIVTRAHEPARILQMAHKAIQNARTRELPYFFFNEAEGPAAGSVFIDTAIHCRYADLMVGSGKL
jgi:GGDEF domain-containing protein